MNALHLAAEALREVVRDRWLHALPLAFLGLWALAWTADHLAIGGGAKAAGDLGTLAVWLGAGLAAIGLGARTVAVRPESVWILARPVSRPIFVAGRYLGVLGALAILVGGLVAALILASWAHGLPAPSSPGLLALLLWAETAVVAALAGLLANLAGPVLGAACTGGLWIASHLADEYHRLALEGYVPDWLAWLVYTLLVPDLDRVVLAAASTPTHIALVLAWCAAWTVALLAATTTLVAWRDLP